MLSEAWVLLIAVTFQQLVLNRSDSKVFVHCALVTRDLFSVVLNPSSASISQCLRSTRTAKKTRHINTANDAEEAQSVGFKSVIMNPVNPEQHMCAASESFNDPTDGTAALVASTSTAQSSGYILIFQAAMHKKHKRSKRADATTLEPGT